MFKKSIALVIITAFLSTSLQVPVYAQAVSDSMPRLPVPGIMVHLSPEFKPAFLKGIVIHPDNPLQFDFIIYKGDKPLSDEQKRIEYTKLTKYFLASLAIPDDDQWVNLSPYEKDRIIKDDFGKTEMGRDLLGQDYILKQVTASLIYPEDNLGKKFWDKVYTQAQQQYGTTNVPVNTFNKVWILPDDALIYEKGHTAYVLRNHLKVMLEEDYLSLKKHTGIQSVIASPSSGVIASPSSGVIASEAKQSFQTHSIASKIIKQIVLPALEKEVNEGENFAVVRQVYSGMLLAAWYKRALRQSFLSRIYTDKGKVKGVDQDPKNNEQIYRQYLRAYKKGVFNFIKEDVDKYTNETIPRKYFSGGEAGYGEAAKELGVPTVIKDETTATPDQNAAMTAEVEGQDDLVTADLAESRVDADLLKQAQAPANQAMVSKTTLSNGEAKIVTGSQFTRVVIRDLEGKSLFELRSDGGFTDIVGLVEDTFRMKPKMKVDNDKFKVTAQGNNFIIQAKGAAGIKVEVETISMAERLAPRPIPRPRLEPILSLLTPIDRIVETKIMEDRPERNIMMINRDNITGHRLADLSPRQVQARLSVGKKQQFAFRGHDGQIKAGELAQRGGDSGPLMVVYAGAKLNDLPADARAHLVDSGIGGLKVVRGILSPDAFPGAAEILDQWHQALRLSGASQAEIDANVATFEVFATTENGLIPGSVIVYSSNPQASMPAQAAANPAMAARGLAGLLTVFALSIGSPLAQAQHLQTVVLVDATQKRDLNAIEAKLQSGDKLYAVNKYAQALKAYQAAVGLAKKGTQKYADTSVYGAFQEYLDVAQGDVTKASTRQSPTAPNGQEGQASGGVSVGMYLYHSATTLETEVGPTGKVLSFTHSGNVNDLLSSLTSQHQQRLLLELLARKGVPGALELFKKREGPPLVINVDTGEREDIFQRAKERRAKLKIGRTYPGMPPAQPTFADALEVAVDHPENARVVESHPDGGFKIEVKAPANQAMVALETPSGIEVGYTYLPEKKIYELSLRIPGIVSNPPILVSGNDLEVVSAYALQLAKNGKAVDIDTIYQKVVQYAKQFFTQAPPVTSGPANGQAPSGSDLAMRTNKGGIDFNAANLKLQIKRDGRGVPLPISLQNLDNIHIDGLIPVIIAIKPASDTPLLSELQLSAGT